MAKNYHLYLISDATGETVNTIARACVAQFTDAVPIRRVWNLVRTKREIQFIITEIEKNPGIVLFTLVNRKLRLLLQDACLQLSVPCVSILYPALTVMSEFLGTQIREEPGRQHIMDAEYFTRIDAINYVVAHDDGQSMAKIDKADIILVGVSRTCKTPTSLYLANRGIYAANMPIVQGYPLPAELLDAKKPLIVGLTTHPERLADVRRNRLSVLNQDLYTDYIDIEKIREELTMARRIFTKHRWPVIDTTRRSIEEIAASILKLYEEHRGHDHP